MFVPLPFPSPPTPPHRSSYTLSWACFKNPCNAPTVYIKKQFYELQAHQLDFTIVCSVQYNSLQYTIVPLYVFSANVKLEKMIHNVNGLSHIARWLKFCSAQEPFTAVTTTLHNKPTSKGNNQKGTGETVSSSFKRVAIMTVYQNLSSYNICTSSQIVRCDSKGIDPGGYSHIVWVGVCSWGPESPTLY